MPAADDATEPSVCARCGGSGWRLEDDDGLGSARRCDCVASARPERLVEAAGIPPRYQHCTLEKFKVHLGGAGSELARALRIARRYVESFATEDGEYLDTGLLFIGPSGTGKTHLAVAILRQIILDYGVRGRFANVTTLIDKLRSTFDPGSPETKRQLLDPVIHADLLVLDELGAHQSSPWVRDQLYRIINTRYTEKLPTIFTTNYKLEAPPRDEAQSAAQGKPVLRDAERDAAADSANADRHGFASAAQDGAGSPMDPTISQLSYRIPTPLVSRLWEMAKPVHMTGVEDFRYQIKAHRHRSLEFSND